MVAKWQSRHTRKVRQKMKTHEKVNETILAAIERGVLPWKKTWTGHQNARNFISGKEYSGINFFILNFHSFSSPYFLTFKQAKDLGGNVKAGSKGLPCVYYNFIEKQADNGDTETIPFAKYSTVFNADQIEGIEFDKVDEKPILSELERIAACDSLVSAMPDAPAIEHLQQRAFYRPSTDSVNMPKFDSFTSPEAYYSTLFHELGHSTGHEKRLNRKGVTEMNHFGSHEYSFEELVAELTAAYLCAETGISNESLIENTASYIDGWSKKLKNNPQWFMQAASKALKAKNFILGIKKESEN